MSLELIHIGHTYGRDAPPVLQDVNLEIGEGETVALMGPSGSGKTTLLAIMGLLVEPTVGELRIDGTPAPRRASEAAALRREAIAWVFQSGNALARRTALDNAALGLLIRGENRAQARLEAQRMLDDVGVGHLAGQEARTLSGGELQRVCVARALATRPRFLFADEPTGQLDRANTIAVIEALVSARPPRTTVVIATHDPEVGRCCDRLVRLVDGRVVSNP